MTSILPIKSKIPEEFNGCYDSDIKEIETNQFSNASNLTNYKDFEIFLFIQDNQLEERFIKLLKSKFWSTRSFY